MSRPLVLYHANCADGFCAAWVAHRKLGNEADYLPVQYGQEPPGAAFDRDRPLYILDFSYSRDVLFKIAAMRHEEVVVLDHHKTAAAALDGLEIELASHNCGNALTAWFDMDKSGGRLAWEYFFPDEPVPWLVDYTEDRDMWRWKLDLSKEISAFISSHPFDFRLWDNWSQAGPVCGRWDTFVDQGSAILRYKDQVVRSAVENATEIELAGHKVKAVNSTVLFSEIAGELAKGYPFGAVYFIRADGKKQWSLRSRESGVDVSEVAKRFGGGGHRNAAGFEEAPCVTPS